MPVSRAKGVGGPRPTSAPNRQKENWTYVDIEVGIGDERIEG